MDGLIERGLKLVPDDTLFQLGTGGDIVLVNKSGTHTANTALAGVLIGTPITPALPANSLILSNVTASGDILVAANLGGNSRSYIHIDASADTMYLKTAGVNRIFLGSAGLVAIGDTANASMTLGLTINQAGYDDEIISLKSSDVAHGVTTQAETDTFALFKKNSATGGGMSFRAFSDANLGTESTLSLVVFSGVNADTTKATTGRAIIENTANQVSGTGAGNVVADGNVFGVRGFVGSAYTTLAIVDINGDLWMKGGLNTAQQAYTASGAIVDNGFVALNQSGSIIAMTLADPGIAGKYLTICQIDTGTQGHTVTGATAGAFDGTNEIATFNAQFETLVLVSVSSTRWVIIENIGAVALST